MPCFEYWSFVSAAMGRPYFVWRDWWRSAAAASESGEMVDMVFGWLDGACVVFSCESLQGFA